MKTTIRTTAAAAILLALAGHAAQASDKDGDYIVRGIGAMQCKEYVQSVDGKNVDQVRSFLSWMDGYLTGVNAVQASTYDVSPITSTALMGQYVLHICRAEPTLLFETAIGQLTRVLKPYKIDESSQLVEITVGDANAAIRQATLIWIQKKLKERGLYKGEPDGLYTAATREALNAFQEQMKIPQTGVPDDRTMLLFMPEVYNLLAKAAKAAPGGGDSSLPQPLQNVP
jgi:hypothetical protein